MADRRCRSFCFGYFSGNNGKTGICTGNIFPGQHVVFPWFLLFTCHYFCADCSCVKNVYTDQGVNAGVGVA